LYKLDELIRSYDLIGILMLVTGNNDPLPKSFIRNINAHHIFYIWEPQQIMPILQLKSTEASNNIPAKEFIEIAQPTPPEPPPTPKKEKPVTFSDKDMQTIYDWANGRTLKELGIHSMQINRLVRKFIKKQLLIKNEPKNTLDVYAELS